MKSTYQNLTKAELIQALVARDKKSRTVSRKPAAEPRDRLLHDLQVHQEELEAQNQSLRQARQLLEESRSRYAELYDLAPLGYVTLDGEGLIREINLTGAAMLGLERSRLIGLPLSRLVVAGDRPLFRRHLRSSQSKADLGTIELHLVRSDHSSLYVELHSVPFVDAESKTRGCLTAITDISERKRMEQAAHESEIIFRAIFNGAGVGMALTDTQGLLRQTNPALQEMLGYTGRELCAMTFEQITCPEDLPADLALYAELVAGTRESYQIEKRYRSKDGHVWWGRLTASVVRDRRGEPLYGIKLVEDITAAKQAAAEIDRLHQGLEQRATELAEANQELDSFSYSVSHDLRTPLASIDQLARMVLQHYAAQIPADVQRYLNLIDENALAMSRLIDDLLAFSRMSRQPLHKQAVATADLVRQVLANLASAEFNHPVELVVGDLPPCHADSALLTQVWVNLLSNAFKFTSKGAAARIEIGSSREENETVYFVKDNGAGFDMDQADRLFRVFQRLHAEEDYAGTGVGLAIVDRIVRRHGGRVWAEAKVDKGATFYFVVDGRETGARQVI